MHVRGRKSLTCWNTPGDLITRGYFLSLTLFSHRDDIGGLGLSSAFGLHLLREREGRNKDTG